MNVATKTKVLRKWSEALPMTEATFERATYEAFETGQKVREYGFRIRTIADGTGDARLIQAAIAWRSDYDVAVESVRDGAEGLVRTAWDPNKPGWEEAVQCAAKRLEKAAQGVGVRGSSILMLILVGNPKSPTDRYQPLSALALGKVFGVESRVAEGMAINTLERLAEVYEK